DLISSKGSNARTVLEQLRANSALTSQNQETVLKVLAEVKEHFLPGESNGNDAHEQQIKYLQTVTNVSKVLDLASSRGL
ncbi:hypothetical protein ABTF91_20295, partial [Acinetobacter baumannii]